MLLFTLGNIIQRKVSRTKTFVGDPSIKIRRRVLGGWALLTPVTLAVIGRPSDYNSVADKCRRRFLYRRQISTTLVSQCEEAVRQQQCGAVGMGGGESDYTDQ